MNSVNASNIEEKWIQITVTSLAHLLNKSKMFCVMKFDVSRYRVFLGECDWKHSLNDQYHYMHNLCAYSTTISINTVFGIYRYWRRIYLSLEFWKDLDIYIVILGLWATYSWSFSSALEGGRIYCTFSI